MQKGNRLQFSCPKCHHTVNFSINELDKGQALKCGQCHRQYTLNDEKLKRQIAKFEALCSQIADSEEILANTSVGIDVEGHKVDIPYKLLLTRMTSKLNLKIGDDEIAIAFRTEPLNELPERR